MSSPEENIVIDVCTQANNRCYTYRVNPFCPNCKEEHNYYDITISKEEQKILDEYYYNNRHKSSLALLLEDSPLVVERTFRCPVCSTVFSKKVEIIREQNLEYHDPDYIPMGRTMV
jgi:hypothetical protein